MNTYEHWSKKDKIFSNIYCGVLCVGLLLATQTHRLPSTIDKEVAFGLGVVLSIISGVLVLGLLLKTNSHIPVVSGFYAIYKLILWSMWFVVSFFVLGPIGILIVLVVGVVFWAGYFKAARNNQQRRA